MEDKKGFHRGTCIVCGKKKWLGFVDGEDICFFCWHGKETNNQISKVFETLGKFLRRK